MDTVVTCVYCGQEYPEGTPTAKAEILTKHIAVCEKHPMREAENKIQILRKALGGLMSINPDSLDEINQMELGIRMVSAPEEDKAVTINALNALKNTL